MSGLAPPDKEAADLGLTGVFSSGSDVGLGAASFTGHDSASSSLATLLAERSAGCTWQPPKAAHRDGGLWLIPPAALREVQPAIASIRADYAPLLELYDGRPYAVGQGQSPTSSRVVAHGGPKLCGSPRRIICSGGPVLPDAAAQLLHARVACVLQGSRLWPAAEQRWGSRSYLKQELANVRCHVLNAPMTERRFSYWFDAGQMGRVDGGYEVRPLVKSEEMTIGQFFNRSKRRAACLYLQHSLLQDGGAGVAPCSGLGAEILHDIKSGLNFPLLESCVAAGRFGPWVRCQLFVGAEAAIGARSILHFDQYDNLFVQISGRKRFRIFDPSQSASLYPFPVHHPLDTRSQIDLESSSWPANFSKAGHASGVEVILEAGECLFLPAYWWHEVTTLDSNGDCDDYPLGGDLSSWEDRDLCVSVNFWFSASRMLLQPEFPLGPAMRLELARQLEYLISDSLDDAPYHVPAFFGSVHRQLTQLLSSSLDERRKQHGWPALIAGLPAGVPPRAWLGLFEFVLWKARLLLGTTGVVPFFIEFCDPNRFCTLRMRRHSQQPK